jgi:hypothetical protein
VRRLDPDTTETLATSSGAGPILAVVFSQGNPLPAAATAASSAAT